MSLLAEYTFEINRKPGEVRTFSLWVSENDNLIKVGYEYLQKETSEEQKPLYRVYDTYALTELRVTTESCEGCALGCGGQKDHMECPGGCLHDPSNCINCSNL